MTIKIAINGYGRIGRNILRAHYENKLHPEIEIVAINDLGDVNTNAHLTRYDTTHGKFPGEISISGSNMVVNGDTIRVVAERDPKKLPWKELNVDVVFECTGLFTSKDKASMHIEAGAKKVIISAPATGVDATVVYGVNHKVLKASDTVISNASCTTNCLATVVKPLHEALGIVCGLMNTVHAFTNDQVLVDVYHSDLRRARSAAQSIIPTKTGAAAAVGLVLPELNGKLDGFAVRVPTLNVSLVDLTFEAKRATSVEEVNEIIRKAANGALKGLLAYNEEQLVSVDFNHNSASAIFDTFGTKVIGNLVKILAWYDNEWGFSNRMLDVAEVWMKAGSSNHDKERAMPSPTMAEVMEVIHRYAPKGFVPKVGMILGSGLSSLAEQISNPVSIPYQAIPGLQSGAVTGHASLLVMGSLNEIPVVCLRGRLHLYEGVTYDAIRTLVRIVKQLGANVLIVTCAAGSMREEAAAGDLMMITDHINFHPGNPLVGQNDESIGPRFVSMENAYDSGLQETMNGAASKLNIPLHKGVYISTLGPSFETPAEIRAFQKWGADAVGMSVVPEVIIARHCNMRVVCVAAITNAAAGLSKEKVTHEGTLQFGEVAARKLIKLIPEFLKGLE